MFHERTLVSLAAPGGGALIFATVGDPGTRTYVIWGAELPIGWLVALTMRGLIPEIQRNALDLNVPIDAILRKVKLCTAKLELSSVEAWISQELDGHSLEAALPRYRQLVGEPLAWNAYNGWIPLLFNSATERQTVARVDVRQPISTLRDLIDNDNYKGMFCYPMPEDQFLAINRRMNFETSRMVIKIGRTGIVRMAYPYASGAINILSVAA